MKITEDNFIDQMKKSNIKALDYIVDNYSNLIYRVAFSVLKEDEISKECVNEALLKLWDNRDRFHKDKGKFTTFVIVITKRLAIDYLRKEKKYTENLPIGDLEFIDEFNLETKIMAKEFKEQLTREINKMNKVNKEIFLRRFILDETVKNIAKVCNLTESAVSNRLLKGKKQLIMVLKEEIGDGR